MFFPYFVLLMVSIERQKLTSVARMNHWSWNVGCFIFLCEVDN